MNFETGKKASRWLLPILLLGTGMVIGHGTVVSATSPAQAATAMSPIDKLLAEDEIRQKLVLYGLYADGNGAGGQPRDIKALANDLMTDDVVSEIHRPNGLPVMSHAGRDFVSQTPPEQPNPALAGRHYIVETMFDDISPTMAHTRSTALYFDMTRNMLGDDCHKAGIDGCGGRVIKGAMWIYEMTWIKTSDGGWKISKNILHDDS